MKRESENTRDIERLRGSRKSYEKELSMHAATISRSYRFSNFLSFLRHRVLSIQGVPVSMIQSTGKRFYMKKQIENIE